MGLIKNISDKRETKPNTKIRNEEKLVKIALTKNNNVKAAYKAISKIKSQENLELIACIRLGRMPILKNGNYSDRFDTNIFLDNPDIARTAIMKITDISILKDLARYCPPLLKSFMSDRLSEDPETCADMALEEYSHGTNGCCAFANKVSRPDLVKKIFCKTSHGSVAKIAADKMSDKELMDTLLSDARSLASRNISGGKYDACHIAKYIVDRLNRLEDLHKLAELAADEKLRGLAQARLNSLQNK